MYRQSISKYLPLAGVAGIYGLADKYDAPAIRQLALKATLAQLTTPTLEEYCDGARVVYRTTSRRDDRLRKAYIDHLMWRASSIGKSAIRDLSQEEPDFGDDVLTATARLVSRHDNPGSTWADEW